ncbi:hypothetical protein BGI41_05970 [Methanobrevibacter sp. 87.7]|uniref:DUF763 domain-containing protein n=1 Tax=Methanobrevibacter sp. 87.7 TaxID=387957 RepID=UPI000B4FE52C|nr:DUF763 domain-containing protein [Methanobrevibacter sp. 87.7]OWT32756.1 hypothetical protein BGI41_05970 [Methanobrevibacter sp. 87.7]
MQRKGIANLPMHTGHTPRWLWERMVKLSKAISEVIIDEYGQVELLERLSNPYWFQSFSCVIGFDWHSSGTTTTTCGALRAALKPEEHGIAVLGGKGENSRKTPGQIEKEGDIFNINSSDVDKLVKSSRLSAKIDNSCIQDNYTLYQHNFFLTEKGDWAVVQQGMNTNTKYARRYHWMSDEFDKFLEDPHTGISCDKKRKETLNMASKESKNVQKISVDLINDNPEHLKKYFRPNDPNQTTLFDFIGKQNEDFSKFNNQEEFTMPQHHPVLNMDLSDREFEVLKNAYEIQPEKYEDLIMLKGIGPKKIRALALISDIIYGEKASWKDPVKYSFAHGGKDGFPYPIDRKTYDNSIETMKDALYQAKLDDKDKLGAIKRLNKYMN